MNTKLKYIVGMFLGALFTIPLASSALSVFTVPQGGTASSSLTGILKGNGKNAIQTATPGTDYVVPGALSSYLSLSSWYATTTDGLDEGLTNLYFTNPRVLTYLDTLSKGYFWSTTSADAWEGTKSRWATTSSDYWLSTKSTTNLTEGSNLYWTSARGTTSFAQLLAATNTDALDEGTTNLYDKTVAFTNGTNVSMTGTYPNFTIADSVNPSFTGLTVTRSTTTNATTSYLYVSGSANIGTLSNLTTTGFVKSTAGALSVDTTAYQPAGSYLTLGSLSASAPISYNNGTGAFSWTGLATTSQPASSNLLVSNGGAGVYGVATGTVSATLPISVTAGRSVIGGSLSVTIADAVADGSTKGAASFTTNDFNTTSGNVSIDYTNGTAASAGAKGFLTSTDWSTFNGKENALTFSYPLSRSVNTISLAFGTTTSNTWAGTQTFTNAPIFSSLTGILKGNGAGAVTVASLGTDYVNGSGTNGNCVAWGASNALTDAGAPCGSGTGGGASQWATSTLFSNMIHTAGAHGIGIGTTTPKGTLSMASSSAVEMWWNNTGASANSKLGWMSWANGIFNFGTSSDAGATTSLLRLDGGTTTVYAQALTVGSGTYSSSLVQGVGTSTMWGGINLSNGGCFAVSGVCMGSMALTGSVGQVNYYSGVNTAVGTSSLFIATNQHVGIGSTSPYAQLSVQGKFGEVSDLFAISTTTNSSGESFKLMSMAMNGKIYVHEKKATTTKSFTLNDPSSIPSITAANYGATYTDDLTRILECGTAAASNIQLRNGGFANAAQQYIGTTAQTITWTTLYNSVVVGRGCLTYGGYHYVLYASTTNAAATAIRRSVAADWSTISTSANWATSTISGVALPTTAFLVGAEGGNIYIATTTNAVQKYIIATSTNTLTSSTYIPLSGANVLINNTRVNSNGIYVGFSAAPFTRKYTLSGTAVSDVTNIGVAVPSTTGPDMFATESSLYGLYGNSTTLLTRIIGY